jgi:Tetracyclin repressor-like, C-terminal domain
VILDQQADQIAAVLSGDEARLRAAFITATTLGVPIGRELLELRDLRDVTPERIAAAVRASFDGLVAD